MYGWRLLHNAVSAAVLTFGLCAHEYTSAPTLGNENVLYWIDLHLNTQRAQRRPWLDEMHITEHNVIGCGSVTWITNQITGWHGDRVWDKIPGAADSGSLSVVLKLYTSVFPALNPSAHTSRLSGQTDQIKLCVNCLWAIKTLQKSYVCVC